MTLKLPKIIFGTSGLGNLYKSTTQDEKTAIIREALQHSDIPVVFDSAGKYGAGLALETLGAALDSLGIDPAKVIISNKLGWLRTPLETPEPQFEPGVWKDLKHDARQVISYDGILKCYKQGNELLGNYNARMVSVHDPDEYLAAASGEIDLAKRKKDIQDAYRALNDLKLQGEVDSVGIGAKDWKTIRDIYRLVPLDWVMIANSMTIHSHPRDLLDFMEELAANNVLIINSAVFNGGFLTGSSFYNYREVNRPQHVDLFNWRETFHQICHEFGIHPAQACVSFGLSAPGVQAVAMSTTDPQKVKPNFAMANAGIPRSCWHKLAEMKLIDLHYFNKYLLNN